MHFVLARWENAGVSCCCKQGLVESVLYLGSKGEMSNKLCSSGLNLLSMTISGIGTKILVQCGLPVAVTALAAEEAMVPVASPALPASTSSLPISAFLVLAAAFTVCGCYHCSPYRSVLLLASSALMPQS